MTQTNVLKLGFIGLGQATNKVLARRHEFLSLPYEVTAAADPRPQAREAFANEFAGPAFDDAEALCRNADVDVVYIATPPELHRRHVEIAAACGKHIVVEKPMALTLADCEAMIAATEAAGVKMLAGHTHSFDAPIRAMRRIIHAGEIGAPVMINTWNFNEFNHRPRAPGELTTTKGPILNQGPHQVDVVRQIGGGLVGTVRAQTISDELTGEVGGYICMLQFADGTPATLVYDGRSFFDTAELFGGVSEGGLHRDPGLNAQRRTAFKEMKALGGGAADQALEAAKEAGRYGAEARPSPETDTENTEDKAPPFQPFFGLTVVSCTRGAMRQSPTGLIVYGDDGPKEVPLAQELRGRAAELKELYEGITAGRPIFHDGAWAMATLEVCLAIIESAASGQEVEMHRQVAVADEATGPKT
jgi:predicted dehydrogenase